MAFLVYFICEAFSGVNLSKLFVQILNSEEKWSKTGFLLKFILFSQILQHQTAKEDYLNSICRRYCCIYSYDLFLSIYHRIQYITTRIDQHHAVAVVGPPVGLSVAQ